MVLYLNTKFPTKKKYNIEAKDNTDRLKSIMEKLVISEAPRVPQPTRPVGAAIASRPVSTAWSYSERKKAAKTFRL